MRNNEQNNTKETGNMLALTTVSMNILILAVLVIGGWGVYTVFSNEYQMREMVRGFSMLQ